jgi:uncharacterized delta-60 repeat protein
VIGLFNEFALARYNSDGTLDTNFGTGGKVLTDFGVSAQAMSAAVQPDGKIVVGGYANLDGGENFEVVRYNSNGTLDATFGTDGKVTTTFGVPQQGFSYALAYSLALQQDGKIVLAGASTINGDYDFALVRYNTNGTLDTSFGTGGRVTTTFGKNDAAFSVAVQPDGKIVTAGFGLFKFALARYNSNGTLDPSFGTGGQETTAIGGLNDGAGRLALQGDGKIVVVGRSYINGDFHSALVRYNSNGTLDAGFGTLTAIFGGESDSAGIALQPDGKILVPGSSFTGFDQSFGLARFNSDGISTTPPPSPVNLALGKSVSQSSTWPGVSTDGPGAAVDGNTNGSFFSGSVTSTNLDANAWWQVDLGASASISSVAIWNRTDCCADRLSDYWVFVSDTPFLASDTPATLQDRPGTSSRHQINAPMPSATIPLTAQGRYVRVQLTGTNYLSLAEVQVLGH